MPDAIDRLTDEFLAHRHELMAYLLALDPDPILAEDILQEVWLHLAKEARLGRDIAHVPAWCRTVARHAWIRHRRVARRERPDDGAMAELIDRAFADQSRDGETWTLHLRALRACLDGIDRSTRRLLTRRYVDAADTRTLAEEFAAAEPTLLMRLSR
ncbi:MAG: hypothetical protein RLZZ127_1925, partial [Planctomycetota bacterium]